MKLQRLPAAQGRPLLLAPDSLRSQRRLPCRSSLSGLYRSSLSGLYRSLGAGRSPRLGIGSVLALRWHPFTLLPPEGGSMPRRTLRSGRFATPCSEGLLLFRAWEGAGGFARLGSCTICSRECFTLGRPWIRLAARSGHFCFGGNRITRWLEIVLSRSGLDLLLESSVVRTSLRSISFRCVAFIFHPSYLNGKQSHVNRRMPRERGCAAMVNG